MEDTARSDVDIDRARIESPYLGEDLEPVELHHELMSRDVGKANTFELRVRGRLSDEMVKALGGSRPSNAATTIVVSVEDRAALHSVIRRVEDFALELVSVSPVLREDIE